MNDIYIHTKYIYEQKTQQQQKLKWRNEVEEQVQQSRVQRYLDKYGRIVTGYLKNLQMTNVQTDLVV